MPVPPLTAAGNQIDPWANTILAEVEQVFQLAWPNSVTTYNRMRTDPQITATLDAYTLPILMGSWAVDPAGCRSEVTQLVADDLGLPVLGVDKPPGSARRRGVRWEEHLRLALLMLVFGHMPFAQQYENRENRVRLTRLAERMPSTISEIVVNGDDLAGIVQWNSRSREPIPARVLVWYAHKREGAAWQGRSMLRPAYGAWLLKHEMWRVHGTSIRRFGMGIPTVEAPAGGTPAQVAEAHRLATQFRAGDQSGAGLPAGFRFNLAGLTGSVPDALAFIRYLDQQMAQSVLASVLNLDASPNGSRALGETLVGLLKLSWSAVAGEIANTATGLAVQMVDYNWGDTEAVPRIVFRGVSDEATAQAIAALMTAGAISPDPALESWARERYGLPMKEETDASDAEDAAPEAGGGREAEQGDEEGPPVEEESASGQTQG